MDCSISIRLEHSCVIVSCFPKSRNVLLHRQQGPFCENSIERISIWIEIDHHKSTHLLLLIDIGVIDRGIKHKRVTRLQLVVAQFCMELQFPLDHVNMFLGLL